MDPALREEITSRFALEATALEHGIRLLGLETGYAKLEMAISPRFENMLGLIHGAAIFTLIDEAFQLASNSHGTVAVALNVSVNFLSSPAVGAVVVAEATELSRTKRTATYQIMVHDEAGALVASCQALAYRTGRPLLGTGGS